MKRALFLLGCLFLCTEAVASEKKSLPTPVASNRLSAGPVAVRAVEPVSTATTTGPGQAGYVHYFVIRKPDDSRETQVGIELADQTIAWSFPELGVVVSPFIASGTLPVNGKIYGVQHLYGIRPLPDEASMLVLQTELAARIMPWVEDGTPHCDLKGSPGELCVSCLGFVLRILYPGRSPYYPALPSDFKRFGPDAYYTTEDLLLYLAGLHGLPTQEARLKRIDGLALPPGLRDELLRLVNSTDPNDGVRSADGGAPRSTAGKSRAGLRPLSKIGQQPLRQRRKL